MSFGKSKGRRPRSSSPEYIDATPGDDVPGEKRPANIQQTKMWQETTGGVKKAWQAYLHSLQVYFDRMTRFEQVQLIERASIIICIGVSAVILESFYKMLPTLLRVFLLPALLVGAWFFAKRVMTPLMIARFEDRLNKD